MEQQNRDEEKKAEGGMMKNNPSMVDNLKQRDCVAGAASRLNEQDREPEPEKHAEKDKRVIRKPRREKESPAQGLMQG